MKLKILVLPFFLVLSLVLSIWYIKPSLDDILSKKMEIDSVNEQLSALDTVVMNIDRFNQSIDQNASTESFFLRYLPFEMNQEQLVDAFSFLASQEGLYISDMDIVLITEQAPVADDPLALVAASPVHPKKVQFTGTVIGSYENIKKFFESINHVNRFQEMQYFSIEEKPKDTIAIEKENNTDLKGTFSVMYGFLPHKSVASAIGMPLFQNGDLKFAEAQTLQEMITNIPNLEKGPSGKPNPFQ